MKGPTALGYRLLPTRSSVELSFEERQRGAYAAATVKRGEACGGEKLRHGYARGSD